eukprot:295148-Chlamydomonas_euryale.AAC.1
MVVFACAGGSAITEPMIFLKAGSSLCGSSDELRLPCWSSDVHHEVELAVQLGGPGLTPVAAAVALDLTLRDVQVWGVGGDVVAKKEVRVEEGVGRRVWSDVPGVWGAWGPCPMSTCSRQGVGGHGHRHGLGAGPCHADKRQGPGAGPCWAHNVAVGKCRSDCRVPRPFSFGWTRLNPNTFSFGWTPLNPNTFSFGWTPLNPNTV